MSFSKESTSSIKSNIIDLAKPNCAIKLKDFNKNSIDDSEDELRVEDISSSSFETSSDVSDESCFANALGI